MAEALFVLWLLYKIMCGQCPLNQKYSVHSLECVIWTIRILLWICNLLVPTLCLLLFSNSPIGSQTCTLGKILFSLKLDDVLD